MSTFMGCSTGSTQRDVCGYRQTSTLNKKEDLKQAYELEEETKSKVSKRKEIIKMRAEIN